MRIVKTSRARLLEDNEYSANTQSMNIVFKEAQDPIPILSGINYLNHPISTRVEPFTGTPPLQEPLSLHIHVQNELIEEVPHIQENVLVEPMQIKQALPQRLRRSHRLKKSAISDDYIAYLQESDFNIGVKEDPLSFQEAIQSIDSEHWQDMMLDELEYTKHNHVLDLVQLPKGVKPIKCRWVYRTKRDSKGKVQRYKARLIAKGFTQ